MRKLTFILLILLVSCSNRNNNSEKNQITSTNKNNDTIKQDNENIKLTDSIKTFVVDDYPVTNDMISDLYKDNEDLKIKSGQIFSLDKAWYTNDTLKQTLVFELYTDYHRLTIFHFQNTDIPTGIIKRMELDISKSKFDNVFDTASYQQKETFFNGFIKSSKHLNQIYFTTNKGFKLSDSKDKVISFYGKPDKVNVDNGIECYEWDFYGEYNPGGEFVHNEKIDLKGKPVAKSSFGYQLIMYFRNNMLIGLIMHNDIS